MINWALDLNELDLLLDQIVGLIHKAWTEAIRKRKIPQLIVKENSLTRDLLLIRKIQSRIILLI